MKFVITMKDPDGFHDSVYRAARESVPEDAKLSTGERDDVADSRADDLKMGLEKWFRYSEYVDIEIDTEAKTATVLPARK